jgi:hypothetical protein
MQPIDVIKVRLQIEGELSQGMQQRRGLAAVVAGMWKSEGPTGFYKGITASLARESSYSALRLGLYEPFKALIVAGLDNTTTKMMPEGAAPLAAVQATPPPALQDTSYLLKILAGGMSGCVGAAIANPTDLVKIRLQADSSPRKMASPDYKPRGAIGTLTHIFTNEGGIKGLWQGVGPNVQRAAILTAAQVGSYDEAKNTIKAYGWLPEGLGLHVAASMVAGLAAAIATAPVDTVKTRMMNQRAKASAPGAADVILYKNTLDCVAKTIRAEGLMALYKGFWPQWIRLGPHTVITFLVYEKLRQAMGWKPV